MESHEPPLTEPPVPWEPPPPPRPHPDLPLPPAPRPRQPPPVPQPDTPLHRQPPTPPPPPPLPRFADSLTNSRLSGSADEEVLEECTPTHDRVCQCRSGYFYAHVGSSESCSPCSTWVILLGGPGWGRGPCAGEGAVVPPTLCAQPSRSPAHSGRVFAPLCSPPPGEGCLPPGTAYCGSSIFSASFCLRRFLCLPFPDSCPPYLLAPHFLQTLSITLCHNLP